MKIFNFLFLLFVSSTLLFSNQVFAQKVAHVNSADILASMKESKAAEQQLASYTKQLEKQYKQKVTKADEEYKAVQKKIQNGLLTPKQVSEQEAYFVKKQKDIQTFELSAQQKVEQKRKELLDPILKKAESAINSIAKSKGYTFVLDASLGYILYAKEKNDLTPAVKTKLGL